MYGGDNTKRKSKNVAGGEKDKVRRRGVNDEVRGTLHRTHLRLLIIALATTVDNSSQRQNWTIERYFMHMQ